MRDCSPPTFQYTNCFLQKNSPSIPVLFCFLSLDFLFVCQCECLWLAHFGWHHQSCLWLVIFTVVSSVWEYFTFGHELTSVLQHECSFLTFVFWIILSFPPTMKGYKHMPLVLIFNRGKLVLCTRAGLCKLKRKLWKLRWLSNVADFMNKFLAPIFAHILGGGKYAGYWR